METAKGYFSPIPIFPVDLFKGEILGLESLKTLAENIYQDKNPLDRFFEGRPYCMSKEDGAYKITLMLPFIMKKDVDLNRVSDELIIRVGSYRKRLVLPRHVSGLKTVKAKLEGKLLTINFTGEK